MAPRAHMSSGRLSQGLLLLWGKCAGGGPGGSAPRTPPHVAALPLVAPGARVLIQPDPLPYPNMGPAWQR